MVPTHHIVIDFPSFLESLGVQGYALEGPRGVRSEKAPWHTVIEAESLSNIESLRQISCPFPYLHQFEDAGIPTSDRTNQFSHSLEAHITENHNKVTADGTVQEVYP